jgi:hypothetical protein
MKVALLITAGVSISLAAEPTPVVPNPAAGKSSTPMGELGKPKPKPAAVKNGDFSEATADGKPEGWQAAYPTGSFSVVKEGGESFLRVEVKGDPANAGALQVVPVPPNSITAVVRGRMRGKPAKSPKAVAEISPKPAASIVFWPKEGPKVPGGPKVPIPPTFLLSEHSAGWKSESKEIPLTPAVKTLEISARCVFATGKFDFDDIEVHFK